MALLFINSFSEYGNTNGVIFMALDKKELLKQFSKDWEKHFKLNCLIERGFKRQSCKKCKRNFWSITSREFCADPSCIGYQFIGNTPVKHKLGYMETWKKVESYFTKTGHKYVKPYPTVARWRDDLYFTIASINDFQPYVVSGELEPPGNPVVVPQPCIRFSDITNVGVTGRHYTNFIMIGQLSFNSEKTGLFYWKEQAIEHDIKYLEAVGIPKEELVFMEDVWMGGGNFGPSMEYFCRGLELGNCVFMQYENLPNDQYRELKTRVIDMGAGLSRLAWMSTGDPTSYEVVFGKVIENMKKNNDVKMDRDLFLKFAKISGSLNEDEVDNLELEKERVAKQLGVTKKELFGQLEPLQALYASADHLLTLLYTINDGMLPSNSGGGYNLRLILRRVFGFERELKLNFNYEQILKDHADHMHYISPELKDGVTSVLAVVEEEKKRYASTKEKAQGKVQSIAKKGKITKEDLFTLYKTHGIAPEDVVEIANQSKTSVDMPGNFYKLVKGEEEDVQNVVKAKADVVGLPKTHTYYYEPKGEFEATVLAVIGKYVILDSTCFYPEGGGQVGDKGSLNVSSSGHPVSVRVLDTQKEAGVVLHEVEKPESFKKGMKVKGIVDMVRRSIISRHHTGAHLLNAAAREVLGSHVWQGGSKKDEHKAHLDLTHYKKITQEELDAIERRANEYIMQNLPIVTEVLPRNVAESKYGFRLYQGGAVPGKELRVVSLGDVDSEACGGTHFMHKTTGELGMFKIMRRESIQDGVERIVFSCGTVALEFMQKKEQVLRAAGAIVSVNDDDVPKTVERFFTEWKEQKKQIDGLMQTVATEEIKFISKEGKEKPVIKILELDANALKIIAQGITKSDGASCVLMNKEGVIIAASGKGSKHSAKELLAKALAKLGGTGGGSDQLAQGRVQRVELFTF